MHRLEDLPGVRTRFTLSNVQEANGLFRVMEPLAPVISRKVVGPRLLRQLREAVETR